MAWFDAHDYFLIEASGEAVSLPIDRPRRIDRVISYFGDPIRHVDDTAQPGASDD